MTTMTNIEIPGIKAGALCPSAFFSSPLFHLEEQWILSLCSSLEMLMEDNSYYLFRFLIFFFETVFT